MDCIFCKIAKKEIPSEIVQEGEQWVAFKDIKPKASIHVLIVPKKHIVSVSQLAPEDRALAGELVLAAQKIAKDLNLQGYKLVINVGKEGGQVVDHLHLHLLAGNMAELP